MDNNPLTPIPLSEEFSTILNCKEAPLVCLLRGLEGLICCVMAVFFIRGYQIMTGWKIITNNDKQIYLLSLVQIVCLAVYYLLFEEFFVLATIRNLLIWTNLMILATMCQVHLRNNKKILDRANILIALMRFVNFVLWFYVAVVDGTTITNTSFNVGYNCLIPDWIILSGYLMVTALMCVFVGLQILDRLNWQGQELKKDVASPKQTIMIFMGTTIVSSTMMFVWDYVAYMYSSTQGDCVDMFNGNNFQRHILFFLLKLITMQIQPLGVYYVTYYKIKDTVEEDAIDENIENEIDLIVDDTASVLNRSLRGDSRISRNSSVHRLSESWSKPML